MRLASLFAVAFALVPGAGCLAPVGFVAGETVSPLASSPPPAAVEDCIAVYFSPDGHGTEAIVNEIDAARASVKVLAYRLTSPPIAGALARAVARGVDVSVVLDGGQPGSKSSDAAALSEHAVPVAIDGVHAIAHNKVMLIDDGVLITGSFNFTSAAERSNAENLLVLKGKPVLMKAYLAEFEKHLGHSTAYRSPAAAAQQE
jgi:phosphatidylserine/phosphatidylglycerophosphate/cardiolipin synthase-like enzyme